MWYDILSITLEGIDFEINPYYICVANKMIEVTQCTIAWYVYESKRSHKNPSLISDIINKAKKHFGDLSVVRGKQDNFLGTYIEIKENIIQVYMVEELEECI